MQTKGITANSELREGVMDSSSMKVSTKQAFSVRKAKSMLRMQRSDIENRDVSITMALYKSVVQLYISGISDKALVAALQKT